MKWLEEERAVLARQYKNDLSWWYPRLAATGIPTPETRIVTTTANLTALLDGKEPRGFKAFLEELDEALRATGAYPGFLRSGHTSDKHEWDGTCYVASGDALGHHVAAIVGFCFCASLVGLPTTTWAARRLLQLDASFTAFSGRMPVAMERRLFIAGGQVLCVHPYWPSEVIEDNRPSREDWREVLAMHDAAWLAEQSEVLPLAETVSRAFDGEWSLDFARDVQGKWWAIDMAQAEDSYHWPACQRATA